ncbi:MAG: DUF3102 domain-containing protein [Oscillospiraceae bacterium]|nr:DUF3102 domain-containing protein [Oscillospiraceae bacterium]
MSNLAIQEPITTVGRSVNTITAEIVAISNQTKQMVVMSAIEIGRRLCEAKALVDHGEWGNYLKLEVKFSQRSAQNCMNIFREYEKNPNSQALANLTYTNAVRLLSLPEDDREELLHEHDVSAMSSRDLDKVIKERDAAKAAEAAAAEEKDKLQTENRDLRQALLAAQQVAVNAKSSEAAWQEEIDKLKKQNADASAAATKAKNQLKFEKEHPTIPDKMRKELASKAATKAAQDAAATYQKQIDEANRKLAEAEITRQSAEKKVAELQAALANSQKSAKYSDPDCVALLKQGDLLQEDFNRMVGYLKKIAVNNPERAAELKVAIQKMVALMAEAVK